MNGRVYDPFLARMISADPTVPGAFNSQAFNRYSYVLNNPLGFTDPSGFSPIGTCGGSPRCAPAQDGAGGIDRNWSPPLPVSTCDNAGCHLEPNYHTGDYTRPPVEAHGAWGATRSGLTGIGLGGDSDTGVTNLDPVSVTRQQPGRPPRHNSIRNSQAWLSSDALAAWNELMEVFDGAGLGGLLRNLNLSPIPITPEERAAALRGDPREFWESRQARGDHVAETALGILDGKGLGAMANSWLQLSALMANGNTVSLGDVSAALAVAHMGAVDSDFSGVPHNLNAGDIARYHHDVFTILFRLPPTAFGGTPFGAGSTWQAFATSVVWCGFPC